MAAAAVAAPDRDFETPGCPFYFHGIVADSEADRRLLDALSSMQSIASVFLVTKLESEDDNGFTHQIRFARQTDEVGGGEPVVHRWLLKSPASTGAAGEAVTLREGDREICLPTMATLLAWNRSLLRLGVPFPSDDDGTTNDDA